MTIPQRFHATIDAIRADLAISFEIMTDAEIALAGKVAMIDYGATHIEPQPRSYQRNHGNWGQDWHEVTLLGVFGTGTTLAEALRDWTKNSLRQHQCFEETVRVA